jgi:hypothetical protein
VKIKVLYFDGCPSYQTALENLRAVIAEEDLPAQIELVQVCSSEEAKRHQFFGSPTIQINDLDLEGLGTQDVLADLGCRVYSEQGELRGWPSKELIRSALKGESAHSGTLTQHDCCSL